MSTKRTMRRVPEDVAEAKYIHGLITKDVEGRIAQLAQEGKHDEMQNILEWKRTWGGIVADLSAEEWPTPKAPPEGWDADLKRREGVTPGIIPAPVTDASEPEGGRTGRTSRPKTA